MFQKSTPSSSKEEVIKLKEDLAKKNIEVTKKDEELAKKNDEIAQLKEQLRGILLLFIPLISYTTFTVLMNSTTHIQTPRSLFHLYALWCSNVEFSSSFILHPCLFLDIFFVFFISSIMLLFLINFNYRARACFFKS